MPLARCQLVTRVISPPVHVSVGPWDLSVLQSRCCSIPGVCLCPVMVDPWSRQSSICPGIGVPGVCLSLIPRVDRWSPSVMGDNIL